MIKNINISALNRTEYDKHDACWGKQIIIASFHTQNFIAVVSKSNFSARFLERGVQRRSIVLH